MYATVAESEGLAQGDIFTRFPVLLHRFAASLLVTPTGVSAAPQDLTASDHDDEDQWDILGLAEVARVLLISQTCDAARSNNLTVVRLLPISFAVAGFADQKLPQRVKSLRTLRDSNGFFYLSATTQWDASVISLDEMLPARRDELLAMRRYRRYRLEAAALQHLQDKLARYFSRMALNPDYMFSTEERVEYARQSEQDEEKRAAREREKDRKRAPRTQAE